MTYCLNCGVGLNGAQCVDCIDWHAATSKGYYASPFGHLFCIGCGTDIPSGHVRCNSCRTTPLLREGK
jgi:hypothetical protein